MISLLKIVVVYSISGEEVSNLAGEGASFGVSTI